MIRIKVIVEGATEEAFVNSLVAPALANRQVIVTPIILGVTDHKGGNVSYARVRKDIVLQLKQDRTAYCSTMFDLYGLGAGFPGAPFAASLGKSSLLHSLQSIRHTFESPEDINDAFATAPSKRILRLYPGYQKVIEGTTAALKIGLEKMRSECKHLNDWLTRLESLGPL